ncbi:MAG: GC-type dockerin domain-anchored protein, partial [Planctomycetota bacterium]
RGHQFAEIDLPDDMYAGDLVVGNSHLKAGGGSNDLSQRRLAAQAVSYNIHYWYGGDGGVTPDPNNVVSDGPPASMVLDENTPVIWGGDWNQDDSFLTNPSGPQFFMLQGGGGSGDGTDADGSNSSYDVATEFFSGNNATLGSSKLDYIAYQDSIATLRHSHVFNSLSIPGGNYPPEVAGYSGGAALVTLIAADHRPVFADFILPEPPPEPECFADITFESTCDVAAPTDGAVTLSDFSCYLSLWSTSDPFADITMESTCDVVTGGGDGVTLSDFSCYLSEWSLGCP